MVSIDLPPEIDRLLADMARATGRSQDQIVIEAILEALEDWEDSQIAAERFEDKGPYIPLEEVIRKFELRDAEEQRKKPAAE